MTKINLNTNASYNFVAPEIAEDANKKVEVNFPTAENIKVEPIDGIIEQTIKREKTIITVEEPLTSDLAIILHKSASIGIGAIVTITIAGAESDDVNLSFGGDALFPELTVYEDKPIVVSFTYNGEKFVPAVLLASPDVEDGKSILSNPGMPEDSIGEDGDHYIDLTYYDLYKKANGNWQWVGNIKGADGATLSSVRVYHNNASGEISTEVKATAIKVDLTLSGNTNFILNATSDLKAGSILILKAILNTYTLTGGGSLADKEFTEVSDGVIYDIFVWSGSEWY